jgi:hypothetical protein
MSQSTSETVGNVGQEPLPSNTPSTLSFPTIIPNLDLNFVWAISVIYTAGALIFLSFATVRICRLISLQKPTPVKLDDEGVAVLHRSKTSRIISYPGIIISKLALRSFETIGIPSLGMLLLICFWVGITGLSWVWFVLPTLSFEGIAYRLP